MSRTLNKAIEKIEKRGALLVFPIKNKPEPASLWSEFYPRSEMRWEWDSGGDNRVANLWHLREELSRSQKVVYTKWYKGRATFFSKDAFTNALAFLGGPEALQRSLPDASYAVLRILQEESPLSTKQLKKRSKLEGRVYEGSYQRALKDLWSRLLIVGFGEVDDGAFPSLAVGATESLFEDLYRHSEKISEKLAGKRVDDILKATLFHKDLVKLKTGLDLSAVSRKTLPKTVTGKELSLFTDEKRWGKG